MQTCTRRLEFDAAHRVMRHESKCAHLHGHRYVIEVTCSAQSLDGVGRVIDFAVVKDVVGGWVDQTWDHGTLVNSEDAELLSWLKTNGQKHWVFQGENPTAECMAVFLRAQAHRLLMPHGVSVTRVVVYETPNCWSEA